MNTTENITIPVATLNDLVNKITALQIKLNEIEWLLKNLQPNPYSQPSFPNKDYPWWKLPTTIC